MIEKGIIFLIFVVGAGLWVIDHRLERIIELLEEIASKDEPNLDL